MLATTIALSLLSVVAAAPCCTPSTTDYNIKFLGSSLCLDNKDGNASNGNGVQVYVDICLCH